MRAFLAVELHDTLGPVVHEWGQAVARALGPRVASGLTWVAPSRVHVTLRFFGELPPQRVDVVVHRLAQAPAPHDPFDLTIGGAGSFPAHGRPRVFWLGFSHGRDELAALRAWARESLAGALADDALETFAPHLTVARVRRDAAPGLGAALREAAARTPAPRGTARVERITLMESLLSPKGPTYRPVAEFPLSPR